MPCVTQRVPGGLGSQISMTLSVVYKKSDRARVNY